MNTLENTKRDFLIIAIDFDGTIVEHQFPRIGKLKLGADKYIRKLKKEGHKIIIWTCRNNTESQLGKVATIGAVKEFLDQKNIPYDAINENVPEMGFWLQSRKIYADIYIDDKNLGGFPGWESAYYDIYFYVKSEIKDWEFIKS